MNITEDTISDLNTPIAIADGGTGATTATAARAALQANLYTFQLDSTGIWNPTDSTTFYGGNYVAVTTANITYAKPIRSGTITRALLHYWVGGTLGTTETTSVYFRLNNTTDYTLTTNLALNARVYSELVTGLSIPITTSDTYEIKMVTPAWVTNPTSIQYKIMFEMAL